MDNTIATFVPRSDTEYEAAVNEQIVLLKQINAQMAADRADIERLQKETETIKAESQRLHAETQARLALLGVAN